MTVYTENAHTPSWKCTAVPAGSPSAAAKKEKGDVEDEELQFDKLILCKNHPEGLECLSYNVVNYTSKPAPRHFVESLKAVMADKKSNPPQKDPLKIAGAFKKWDEARPAG